jgi:UDP-N-acetyl-alpha-D-muramoyl-L-alanyl-L-glutamate epimerase
MQIGREEIQSFHATGFDFDSRSGVVNLRYSLSSIHFEELIDLGGPLRLDPSQEHAFERVLRLLHAAAGTSYYKAAAPPVVSIESGPLTPAEHALISALYDKGLREFAFRNGLQIPLDIELRATIEDSKPGTSASGPGPALAVPIGGGKDSIVLVEALKDQTPVLVAVNASPAALRISRQSGLELVRIERRLDESLVDLNRNGALNGHVPVTAIVSLAVVAAGYAHGYSTTVMALEGSADEATRMVNGCDVNHQWSKTSEFESALRAVLLGISPQIRYGSALRRLSELEIAAAFARMSGYHHSFRSCNRAFSLSDPFDGWCCNCPKCRFVYLMLATVMESEELTRIFGKDLFSDPDQSQGFCDLLETDRKPFECVGTLEESVTAFREVIASGQSNGSPVLDAVAPLLEERAKAEDSTGAGATDPRRRTPEEVLDTVKKDSREVGGRAELVPRT